MKPVLKKVTMTVLPLALFGGWLSLANAEHVKTLPLNTTEGTEAVDVTAKTVKFLGREGLQVEVVPNHKGFEDGGCDNCTYLLVDKEPFKNGIIEIDLAGKPSAGAPAWARGFVGVVFRVNADKSKYEGIYLRPLNALEKGPRRNYTVQHFSFPDYPWYRLRKEFPNQYEAYADVKPGEWINLRIEVDGATAKCIINGQQVLAIDKMFHGADLAGGIGLFTEPETDAYFSKLKITYK